MTVLNPKYPRLSSGDTNTHTSNNTNLSKELVRLLHFAKKKVTVYVHIVVFISVTTLMFCNPGFAVTYEIPITRLQT